MAHALLTRTLAILGHLQSAGVRSIAHKTSIPLPPTETLKAILLGDEELSQGSSAQCTGTYTIYNTMESLWHVADMLSMLVDIILAAAASNDATAALQDYLAWVLDSFLVIHELQKGLGERLARCEPNKRPDVLTFCTVHALLLSLREVISETILCKGYILLAVVLESVTEDHTALPDDSTRNTLCSSILQLSAACRKYDSVLRTTTLYLLPTIMARLNDERARMTLAKEMEVDKFSSLDLPVLYAN